MLWIALGGELLGSFSAGALAAYLAAAVQTANDTFTASMSDDLNVSEALAAVFEFVGACNKSQPSVDGATAALAAFARFEDVLAVFGEEPAADVTLDAGVKEEGGPLGLAELRLGVLEDGAPRALGLRLER